MAEAPEFELNYERACPDCGNRVASLPARLPDVGDDFNWLARDYDGFRRFMLEELAARFPRRTSWTAADLEVVLVEALAARLDQLSDLLDRVTAESWLETAREPRSVRRLLAFIGFDAVNDATVRGLIGDDSAAAGGAQLDALWTRHPELMEEARRNGPSAIRQQKRMVSLADYAARLEEHPLVLRAHAWSRWSGSWYTIRAAVIALDNRLIDTPVAASAAGISDPEAKAKAMTADAALWSAVESFHHARGIAVPGAHADKPTVRQVLQAYLDAYRMAGQEAILQDAEPVGISIALSVRVADHYFRSEVQSAIEAALKEFFAARNLRFGQDLMASDIFQAVMALPGVDHACLNRFKRVGSAWPNQTAAGRIAIGDLEIAVCDNLPGMPERGYFHLTLIGGLAG